MQIYTDGSCLKNGSQDNSGGFGIVVIEGDKIINKYSEMSVNTTNNREELKAIIYAFLRYGSKENPPEVYTDSSYCYNTFTSWMFNWAKNNWVKSDKKTPENLDLIKIYYNRYQQGYRINLNLVKGHAGNPYNELADRLATGKEKV